MSKRSCWFGSGALALLLCGNLLSCDNEGAATTGESAGAESTGAEGTAQHGGGDGADPVGTGVAGGAPMASGASMTPAGMTTPSASAPGNSVTTDDGVAADDDAAADDAAADDANAVDSSDDGALDDSASDDSSLDDSSPDDAGDDSTGADDSASDGTALDDDASDDSALDDPAVDDPALDDTASDDTAVEDDGTLDDSVADDASAFEPSGEPTHEERQALPTVRQEHSAAALDGKVYVIGGFTPSVTASVQVYDPDADSWSDAPDFPEALHHANVASVGDSLYVLGFNRGSSFSNVDGRVFAYDTTSNQWSPRQSMPVGTERASACVATLGSKIYLFGGVNDTSGSGATRVDASVFDTESNEWEVLPDMPEPREHCLAGGVAGKLYIVSGRAGSITAVEVESWEFDPSTATYSERAGIPTPRGGTAGAVLGNAIYVFGGEGNGDDPNGVFHEVEVYDPLRDSWESLPDMLIPRHGFGAAALAERIYLPGGATRQGFGAGDAHSVFFFE